MKNTYINPKYKGKKEIGRFRFAFISYSDWCNATYIKYRWLFCFRNYPDFGCDIQIGGYWQLTIFGFMIGYCYRDDWETTKRPFK